MTMMKHASRLATVLSLTAGLALAAETPPKSSRTQEPERERRRRLARPGSAVQRRERRQ